MPMRVHVVGTLACIYQTEAGFLPTLIRIDAITYGEECLVPLVPITIGTLTVVGFIDSHRAH